jgi:hypothetical protein
MPLHQHPPGTQIADPFEFISHEQVSGSDQVEHTLSVAVQPTGKVSLAYGSMVVSTIPHAMTHPPTHPGPVATGEQEYCCVFGAWHGMELVHAATINSASVAIVAVEFIERADPSVDATSR